MVTLEKKAVATLSTKSKYEMIITTRFYDRILWSACDVLTTSFQESTIKNNYINSIGLTKTFSWPFFGWRTRRTYVLNTSQWRQITNWWNCNNILLVDKLKFKVQTTGVEKIKQSNYTNLTGQHKKITSVFLETNTIFCVLPVQGPQKFVKIF